MKPFRYALRDVHLTRLFDIQSPFKSREQAMVKARKQAEAYLAKKGQAHTIGRWKWDGNHWRAIVRVRDMSIPLFGERDNEIRYNLILWEV